MKMVIKTLAGLEQVLAKEVKELGGIAPEPPTRAV